VRPLPEKPVLITFDDGYESVYTLAYPILQKMDFHAVTFPVGVSVGKDTYKDTGISITPHFSWEQGAEMAASGVISIQSHTYDMHQWREFEETAGLEFLRPNALRRPGESVFSYANALWDDLQRFRQEASPTGEPVVALAYPGGSWDSLSEKLLASYGVKCTFTIRPGKASVRPGSQKDLYGLHRFYVTPEVTDEEFLNWLK
jgi:peptidoglycan/xylan/chitin deacetylase (PgdA/CDA1 family)